jgi:hypothetical protein
MQQLAACRWVMARAQEDGPVIWEALSVLHERSCEVVPSEGNRSSCTKQCRESEGRIGAKTSGNGWHSDPSEQRRPVLM